MFSTLLETHVVLRMGLAAFTALLLALIFGHKMIYLLSKMQKNGQPIREDGPKNHLIEKAGTPTMGGVMIIINMLVGCALWGVLSNPYVLICLFTVVSYALLGFFDDYSKVKLRSARGISAKFKFIMQLILALIITYFMVKIQGENAQYKVAIPLSGDYFIDLGPFYYIFSALVIVGASNAVNLTDGLDGLVTLPIILVATIFTVVAFIPIKHAFLLDLGMPYIKNIPEIAIVTGALIGALLGFLWFNAKPAQIFMGDVGSLAFGALLGVLSIITKHEILLAIAGGLFVIEAISVILQVLWYKRTKKRLFLMAPIHHHFEKKGWSETQVVIRFWIIAVLFAAVSVFAI